MRSLTDQELNDVSGGAAFVRAAPATDVTPVLPGNRTGWCRGYGNIKTGQSKHAGTSCGCDEVVSVPS